jgi:hypothetical protein
MDMPPAPPLDIDPVRSTPRRGLATPAVNAVLVAGLP